MSQKFFTTGKVGLFLDDYKPSLEKRKSGETKILTLTLRCQPFDSKLAGSIDTGLGEDSNVKPTLFKLTDSDPKPHLRRVNFDLACPRQNLKIFASPDTEEAPSSSRPRVPLSAERFEKISEADSSRARRHARSRSMGRVA